MYKTAFSARDQHVLSFSYWAHNLLAISAKCTRLYKTAFSARDRHILSFSHWAHHVLAIFSKVHTFVQNSLFSLISARFVIFALSEPLFSNFQQSERVCSKHSFQPPTSEGLRFLHFAHHSLAIFRKLHEFVQINVFSPRYARFVIFALGALLLSDFQQVIFSK